MLVLASRIAVVEETGDIVRRWQNEKSEALMGERLGRMKDG